MVFASQFEMESDKDTATCCIKLAVNSVRKGFSFAPLGFVHPSALRRGLSIKSISQGAHSWFSYMHNGAPISRCSFCSPLPCLLSDDLRVIRINTPINTFIDFCVQYPLHTASLDMLCNLSYLIKYHHLCLISESSWWSCIRCESQSATDLSTDGEGHSSHRRGKRRQGTLWLYPALYGGWRRQ